MTVSNQFLVSHSITYKQSTEKFFENKESNRGEDPTEVWLGHAGSLIKRNYTIDLYDRKKLSSTINEKKCEASVAQG